MMALPLLLDPVTIKVCGSIFQLLPEPNPFLAPLWLPPPPRSISSITLTPIPASHLATFTSQFPHNHQSGLHHASCSQAPPRTEPKALVTAHQGLRDMALVYLSVLSLPWLQLYPAPGQIFTRWSTGYLRAFALAVPSARNDFPSVLPHDLLL